MWFLRNDVLKIRTTLCARANCVAGGRSLALVCCGYFVTRVGADPGGRGSRGLWVMGAQVQVAVEDRAYPVAGKESRMRYRGVVFERARNERAI
jgi:hypothetical protein